VRSGVTLTGRHFWFGTFTGLALLTVVAIPVAALAVLLLARRRGARTALAEVGMVYWTAPMLWMTMLPNSGAGVVPGRTSLVPFRDLLTMSAPQIVGNLLIFAALGFFAPMRFAALASVRRVLLLAAACSVTVEVAQYVLQLDRVSSVDDVLLNTTGAGLAALASYRWWRRPTCRGHIENRIRPGNAARS
jgi:glycopeptide antibiotics resistance protein